MRSPRGEIPKTENERFALLVTQLTLFKSMAATASSANPFTLPVVAAVMKHMNSDHSADSLLIVKAFGGEPNATSATMSGMDGEAIEFDAIVNGSSKKVRVAWSHPLTERAQIRPEVVRMYREACKLLGVTPREEAKH